jgi:hypothetical protein
MFAKYVISDGLQFALTEGQHIAEHSITLVLKSLVAKDMMIV